MNDTIPEIDRRFRAMVMARSGEERLKMGCSMHQFAQTMVRASVLAQHPQATPAEVRRALVLRFYGRDLGPDHLRAVLATVESEDRG